MADYSNNFISEVENQKLGKKKIKEEKSTETDIEDGSTGSSNTSDSESDKTNENKEEKTSSHVTTPSNIVVYDDSKAKLMEKYSEMVLKKNNFGGTQSSWYTLKFYTMKETLAAKYYIVEMEFSNNDQDPMKQLNIWLKATYIHDVLKYLATNDKDAKALFNGFEKVITAGELAEIRIEANGANICRSNTSNGYVYKQYVNYYLIQKEMGSFKHVTYLNVKKQQSKQYYKEIHTTSYKF